MKTTFPLLVLLILFSSCGNTKKEANISEENTTTYYLIRHAEKDKSNPSNRNPELEKKGFNRAISWSKYFKDIDLNAVYSTNYNRTLQTATPTAVSKALTVQLYDPTKLYDKSFKEATHSKTVLIVGHSNTTPSFVNAILGEAKYENMNEDDNGTLFKVVVKDTAATASRTTVN